MNELTNDDRMTTAKQENPPTQQLQKIYLSWFRHRDQNKISLKLEYNTRVKDYLKQQYFVRWTQSHRCFYIQDHPDQIKSLINHCRDKIWVDITALHKAPKALTSQRQVKSTVTPIAPDILDKIKVVEFWMKQKRYQQTTIATYLSFIRSFFACHLGLKWNGITSELITSYNYEHFIKNKRSYSAQNQWINAIKLYLLVHQLDVGDLAEIERPRKQQYLPEILSPSEIKKILHNTPNIKHRTLLMLIYSCGLRIGEALALRLGDIRNEEGLIYLRGDKGNKDRRVPLSPRILEQLSLYYRSYRPGRHLFEGQKTGEPYSSRSAAQLLKRAVQKSGITKKITLHTLRHSFATHVTNKGVNIQYLQETLGYNSPKTTMIYTHLSGKDIREIRSPLDDLDI